MVKSYTGVRKAFKKEIQQVHVADFMSTKLITFRPDQPIGEVAKILMSKNISGGPVVDEAGNLIGIISEGDCLKEIVKGEYTNTLNHSGTVADHMARDVYTIEPDCTILDAASKFLKLKVRRFPVLKDGKMVGQVSQRDVMRAVHTLKKHTW